MRPLSLATLCASVGLIAIALSCSSKSSSQESGCEPGDQLGCMDESGCSGTRTCDPSRQFGACVCGTGGTGATGGSAGSGGTGGDAGSGGDGFLKGWGYRRPLTIDNSGSALDARQVLIAFDAAQLLAEGKLRGDAADLRFTDTDNKVLPHWLETAPTAQARVWVRVPALPNGVTEGFVYYGNSAAADVSNGGAVFEFFDDFDGSTLDLTKWTPTLQAAGTGIDVTGGELVFSTGGGINTFPFNSALIVAKDAADESRMIGVRLRVVSAGAEVHTDLIFRSGTTQHWYDQDHWVINRFSNFTSQPSARFRTEISNPVGALGGGVELAVYSGQPTHLYLRRRVDDEEFTAFVDGKAPQSLSSTDVGWGAIDAKYIGLGAGNTASASAYDFRYDWFFSAKDLPDAVDVQIQAEQAAP